MNYIAAYKGYIGHRDCVIAESDVFRLDRQTKGLIKNAHSLREDSGVFYKFHTIVTASFDQAKEKIWLIPNRFFSYLRSFSLYFSFPTALSHRSVLRAAGAQSIHRASPAFPPDVHLKRCFFSLYHYPQASAPHCSHFSSNLHTAGSMRPSISSIRLEGGTRPYL